MKTLLLLRHGKSDWDANFGTDHDRPLAKRGEKAAKQIGRYLKAIDEIPDVIVSSTAERAVRTAIIAAEAGDWDREVIRTRDLYEASPTDLVDVVNALDDDHQSAMLVGHEPTWSATVSMLTGANVRFPTAGLARIDFERSTWKAIGLNGGYLAWFVIPKSLPDKI